MCYGRFGCKYILTNMKKYIKIKTVMAEPMTMAEAHKHYFIID